MQTLSIGKAVKLTKIQLKVQKLIPSFTFSSLPRDRLPKTDFQCFRVFFFMCNIFMYV